MRVAVLKEVYPGENCVPLIPSEVKRLQKMSCEVLLEKGAGDAAGFRDSSYEESGAKIIAQRDEVIQNSDLILTLSGFTPTHCFDDDFLSKIRSEQSFLGMLSPFSRDSGLEKALAKACSCFALEKIPRISRAQSMDILTSIAFISGYKAALLAASRLGKVLPMLVTAAGTLRPAKALVVGVGIAGLQAIATLHRLGAQVEAYDIRPAVKGQVESLGARFLEIDLEANHVADCEGYAKEMDAVFYKKQQELMLKAVSHSDIVITAASVYGKKAPKLLTKDMISQMREGSVVFDLSADGGGNCEASVLGGEANIDGVSILAPLNLKSSIAQDASKMISHNFFNFLSLLYKEGEWNFQSDDEIVKACKV